MTATVPEFDGAERRSAPRMRVLKRAKLIFNGGFSTFDCIVRNVSATGALLTIDDSVQLPKEFRIRIGDEQAMRPAELIYRRSLFAGIRFLDLGEHGGGAFPLSREHPHPHEGNDAAGGERPQGIRRLVPERLPEAVTCRFAWHRGELRRD
ncbi:PilZ domain-containing protein [Jiella avicenniae]|uniref:PilZ domain-containing protein n=1 Tax=Jiella avicenniae TaxID=2907202 RepID=A0A9X1NYC6_9HYPH|nr:PilZ domain-containing protein [Jiella avicenniae]MCE7026389.1 PilZ domain-containing protein [Jiella avicenniae]